MELMFEPACACATGWQFPINSWMLVLCGVLLSGLSGVAPLDQSHVYDNCDECEELLCFSLQLTWHKIFHYKLITTILCSTFICWLHLWHGPHTHHMKKRKMLGRTKCLSHVNVNVKMCYINISSEVWCWSDMSWITFLHRTEYTISYVIWYTDIHTHIAPSLPLLEFLVRCSLGILSEITFFWYSAEDNYIV